jgi:hypothetical protein
MVPVRLFSLDKAAFCEDKIRERRQKGFFLDFVKGANILF